MALPVLDGNQSATTLSSVVTGGEHIVAHTVVSLGSAAISNITNAVSGSVVSVSNFPSTQTIAGTVTANVPLSTDANGNISGLPIGGFSADSTEYRTLELTEDNKIIVGSLPAISGTVTANVVGTRTFVDVNAVTVSGFLAVGGWDVVNSQHAPIPLTDGGTGVKISYDDENGTPLQVVNFPITPFLATVTVGNSVTIGSLPAISGTVTANVASTTVTVSALPSGALTTRFGSVTTANTAQITSAVTNTSRKYLLAQNISAGTVTIGIGFSPTTTQGIQLTAGGGLTFDAFCPTGAVYWLGAVTGAAFTILEG